MSAIELLKELIKEIKEAEAWDSALEEIEFDAADWFANMPAQKKPEIESYDSWADDPRELYRW